MLASPIVRRGPGVEGRWGAGSLQLQLLLTLALLAVGPVLVLGAVQAKIAEDHEVERSDRETLLATSSLARELGRIVEANANIARSLATEVASEGRADAALVAGKTERYLRTFPGLYGVYVLDDRGVTVEGTVWADSARKSTVGTGGAEAATKSTVGTSYADRHWFREILDGAPFASEFLRSRTTGRPGVILIAPIRDKNRKLLGVIGVGVELDFVQGALERVSAAAPGLSAVVIDPSDRVVAATRGVRAEPLQPLGNLALYRSAAPVGPEPRIGRDETGVPRRGTAAPIESTAVTWSIISSLPLSLLRQRKLHALLTTGGIAAGALLAGLGVALFLSRQLAQPVAGLSTFVEAIGKGDLRGSAPRQGRLSPRELVHLERSIVGMLAHLKSVIAQLGSTVVALRAVTERLHDTSAHMIGNSRSQQEAVRKSSMAIVQISDANTLVGGSLRGLWDTASSTANAILDLDRQIDRIAGSLQELSTTISSAMQCVDRMQQQVIAIGANAGLLGSRVGNTNASLRGLAQSIEGVAGRAEHGRSLARHALSAAEAGRVAVHETIEATQEIERRFLAIEQAVRSLASRSEAIGGVANVIEEVMRAIRLVGINASIIASAAGEQGKGFGVVVERVRSMAADTEQATERITQLVGSVQSDILHAVEAMQHGQHTVEVGAKRSAEAGVRLQAIIESSTEAEQTSQKIAVAMQEQARDVRVVVAALDEVGRATEHIQTAVQTQRETQQSMSEAIERVRAVGVEVRESTRAQQTQSQTMTSSVRTMTNRFKAIAESVEAQGKDRGRIEGSLSVFEDASRSSVERARQLGQVVDALRERLDQLERELGAFRVD
jgi:methyl-accepting chemotaxis protein